MLVLAVFAAYFPAWHGGWLWDDGPLLLNNPVLKPGGLAKVWTPPGYINFWPLTYTVYWAEFHLWRLEPLGYHLVNIGLHALAALLVWRVLVRLQIPGALFAAAIFALHPVNVESVAWVAQLKGILSLVLALSSVLLYLSFELSGRGWRYGLAVAAFVLAALSKGEVLPLPVVLLALAWWQRGRIRRSDILRVLPFFVIAAVLAGVEIWTQHLHDSAVVRSDGFFSRVAIAGCAVWFYLGKILWPINLSPIYARWDLPAPAIDYLPSALLIGLLVGAWKYRTSWGRPVVMFLVCYVALLAPELGLVNITYMRYSLVADHWQYFASIVPCAAVAAACAYFAGRWWRTWLAAVARYAFLVLLAALTWRHCAVYANPESFYRTAIANDPNCWIAEELLGEVSAGQRDLNAAISHFQRAEQLNANDADIENDFGSALLVGGQFDSAIAHLQRAVQIQPEMRGVNYKLAYEFERRGEFDSTIKCLQRELEIDPENESARRTLKSALSRRAAHADILKVLQVRLQRTPKDPALLDDIAWTLATSPFASLRDGTQSLRLAELAWKIAGGNDARALGTLAAAYAESGQFPEAIAAAENGLRLADSSDNAPIAALFRACLAQYHAGKPFRDSRLGE